MKSLLLAAAVAVSAATAEKHDFTFVGPSISGWVDLSGSMNDPATKKMLPDWIPHDELAAFAADVHENGFFIAGVEPGTFQMTEKQMELEEAELKKEIGEGYVLEKKEIVQVGGVPSGRILFSQTTQGIKLKALAYLIPGKKHAATCLYMARAEDFDPMLPQMEASALATQGAVHHKYANLSRELKGGIATLVLAVIIGGIKSMFSGKKEEVI